MFPTLRDLCISFALSDKERHRGRNLPSDLLEELEEIRNGDKVRLFKNGRPGLYKLLQSPERGLKISLQRGYHQQIWYFLSQGVGNLYQAVGYAAEGGNLALVTHLISKIGDVMDFSACVFSDRDISIGELEHSYRECICVGLQGAARGGHSHLVEFFIKKGADNWDWGLCGAARGGHLDLMEFFLAKGATNRHNACIAAVSGGHTEIVMLMFEDRFHTGTLYKAAQGGHWELVNFLISKGEDNWNLGLIGAARGGHFPLVEFFIEKGASEWNWGMCEAARGGHLPLVEFFIDKGANNWKSGLQQAAYGDHLALVEFFISKGISNWEYGLDGAAYCGDLSLVEFFVAKGAKQWRGALDTAIRRGNRKVAKYLRELLFQ